MAFAQSLIAATLACVAAAGQAAPDLDALVRYETRAVLANGTTRVETWSERLVRRGDRVWTERVLSAAAHEAEAEHAGHKHFDAERAARLVILDKGEPQLQYVDREHRQVVHVPKAEWGAVGFDGRYDAAAHLVPPSLIERMAVQGEWRVQKAQGWTHRVLWSAERQVALRIESRRDDGSYVRRVNLQPMAAAAALPWTGLAAYQQHDYDDFMD
jgi:hypothetical protein